MRDTKALNLSRNIDSLQDWSRCLAFFTSRDQHLLRGEEMQRADRLICLVWYPRQVASLLKNEQQSQNLLLKVDPRSTSRNKFLNPQYIFVARQVDRPKTCNEAMLRDTLRVFVFRISPPERDESAFLVLQKQARNRLFSNALSQLLRMILSNLSRGLTWILTLHSF